jgi:hypothetical protein
VRLVMWKATARIIKARPFSGVGAGAWEVDIPLYWTKAPSWRPTTTCATILQCWRNTGWWGGCSCSLCLVI